MTSVSHATEVIACCAFQGFDRPKSKASLQARTELFCCQTPRSHSVPLVSVWTSYIHRLYSVKRLSMPSSCVLQVGTLLYLQPQPHCPPTCVYPGHTLTTESK